MRKKLNSQAGYSLFGALAVMVALGFVSLSVVDFASVDSISSVNDIHLKKAKSITLAGIETVSNLIDNGRSGDLEHQEFDGGWFESTTNPASGTIIVTGHFGDAVYSESISRNFARDCVQIQIDESTVSSAGSDLRNLRMIKSCNTAATLTTMTVSWNWSSCSTDMGCSTDYNDYLNDQGQVMICHRPPGNPCNSQDLTVSVNGWLNGHSGGNGRQHNLDNLGPCGSTCVPRIAPTLEELAECAQDDHEAAIDRVELGGTAIYSAGSIPEVASAEVPSGSTLDVVDTTLTENRTYSFDTIHFNQEIPSYGVYTVTLNFADGSTLTKVYQDTSRSAVVWGYDTSLCEEGDGAEGEEESVEEEAEATTTPTVSAGTVTVSANNTVDLQVLGSAITCGEGGREISVDVELGIDGSYADLFHGHDVDGGELYTITVGGAAHDYTVRATASSRQCGNYSRTLASTDTTYVRTLTNGQQAPSLQGFGGQRPVTSFLRNYLDGSGRVVLDSNQVIQLWELGSTSTNSSAADFQDLVILFTVR